jgi:hypothetical protein
MVKMAIVGKFRCSNIDSKKSSEKEIKKAVAVFILSLTVPLRNKIMGRKNRQIEPITGMKAMAKTKEEINNKSFKKGLLGKGMLILFKDDNRLKNIDRLFT